MAAGSPKVGAYIVKRYVNLEVAPYSLVTRSVSEAMPGIHFTSLTRRVTTEAALGIHFTSLTRRIT
jgi:hypothetical protein